MGKIKTESSSFRTLSKLGIFASSLLVSALAVYFYSPVIKTHADEDTNFEVKTIINSMISLVLDTDELDYLIVPTDSGAFESKSITATVSTNSSRGYELYFSSENNETSMKNVISSMTDAITSDFSDTVTAATMAANTWGYSLDNTDFSKIPTLNNQATIKNLDHNPSSSEKDTTVYIGAKISSALPSGTYNKSVKFSAIAHEIPETAFGGITILQDMTPAACAAASTGDTATLRDIRDGNTYTVKKLADGRCWMTENLRIAGKTITSTDSDLPAGETYTIPASNIANFTAAQNTSAAYYDANYGGYYNFYTATAGWGTSSATTGNSPKSICPKGWRLPTGGASGEFNTLYSHYNSGDAMMGVPGFVLSGLVYGGSAVNQSTGGYYWSSTTIDTNDAYSLIQDGSNVIPVRDDHKFIGFAVRCVANEEQSIPTMQTFDKTTLANIGDSTQLKDARDGNIYTVKKLKDGNVWMTQNLRIINKTISDADSNLPTGTSFTIPASSLSDFTVAYDMNASYYAGPTYGSYYTFYTATAGWGTYSVDTGNAPRDICPKGWRLPTGYSTGEFGVLASQYRDPEYDEEDPAAFVADGNFIFSGRAHNDLQRYPGSIGYYWSSTVDFEEKVYYLIVYNNDGDPKTNVEDSFEKYDGMTVRCIAK